MSNFAWIKNWKRKTANEVSVAPRSVSDIVPNEFDAYFFIHWNIGIVDNFPFDEFPATYESTADINERIRINRAHGLFLNPDEDSLFRMTSVREIATIFNKKYSYETLTKIKNTRAIKTFDAISISNLKALIQRIAKEEVLNFFIADIEHYVFEDTVSKQETQNISIEDYFSWTDNYSFDHCTYLFPDNKKWCLTTTEDFPMFLCVKKALIENIEKESNMELFRVDYDEKLYSE